ncbi:hypothetical protein [Listeria booriae]|uniref:hypothetical protein n=1 Tax=Listeria booriae TaxID=1552123 RepID=UPI00163DCA0F|nr:hypothetical protein [Listeria booriae]MBC1307918.1 hypothetical protein [Listeria booriae]
MYVIKAHSINQYIKTIAIENGNVYVKTTVFKSKAMEFRDYVIAMKVMGLIDYTHFGSVKVEKIEVAE